MITECPNCHADLSYTRPPSETVYSRVIGIYDIDLDRTTEWLCPDCGFWWDR